MGMKDVHRKIQEHLNENKKIDIEDIESKLEEGDQTGPLLCGFDHFKFLYSSQKRMRRHGEERDYLELITLMGDEEDKERLIAWKNLIKTSLDHLLRKGDIFTFCNETQAMLLLKDVKPEGIDKIERRIGDALGTYKDCQMKIKFSPIITEESLESFSEYN